MTTENVCGGGAMVILNIIISLSKEICKFTYWEDSNFGVYFQYSLVSLKIFPNGFIRSYVAHEKGVTDKKFLEFRGKIRNFSSVDFMMKIIKITFDELLVKLVHPK